jgi:hypothetical protein
MTHAFCPEKLTPNLSALVLHGRQTQKSAARGRLFAKTEASMPRCGERETIMRITIEQAKQETISHLKNASVSICGRHIPHIDLGVTFLSTNRTILLFQGKAEISNSEFSKDLPNLRRIADYMKCVEEKHAEQSRNRPSDESSFSFFALQCSDGCIGIILNTPSILSPVKSHCLVRAVPCDEGTMDGSANQPLMKDLTGIYDSVSAAKKDDDQEGGKYNAKFR